MPFLHIVRTRRKKKTFYVKQRLRIFCLYIKLYRGPVMTWKVDDKDKGIQVEETPVKTKENVHHSDTSPIQVNSSPPRVDNNLIPPSRIKDPGNMETDEEKERKLEAKRQSIRNHKDFPMVRRRFYYLQESDIFKGFVKGKGNLREITQWLEDNYNKDEILKKQEQLRKEAREANKAAEVKKEQERILRQNELAGERNDSQPIAHISSKGDTIGEEDSPIKVKSQPRIPPVASPTSTPGGEQNQHFSTKVEISKPKVSILDKYRYSAQPSNPKNVAPDLQAKKRRLVRAGDTVLSGSNSPSNALTNSLGLNFSPTPQVEEEADLDKMEEKIRANRKAARKNKKSKAIEDDLEDELSDGVSEEGEDDNYNGGLTRMDDQIIEFLNQASKRDLIEISNVTPEISDLIVSKRPYSSIYAVSEDNFESYGLESNEGSKKRKGQKKTLGQKIVENTEFSLRGYKAVDSLVRQCSEYGDLIFKQMERWGVRTGSNEGELDLVDVEPSQQSSGIKDVEADLEDDEDEIKVLSRRTNGLPYISKMPAILSEEIDLKDYQVVGINWLNLLYRYNLSCILADDMGLGKTCQVISFMAYLKDSGKKKGPHLVVVPSSTLENWLREFQKFCPDLIVQAYYGSQSEREDLRYDLQDAEFDVLVTTYNLATGAVPDFKFLRNMGFDMIVYDEGHMLKNSTSERYNKLMRLRANFRLLLTGTPLQNNLRELVSLLSFMLPNLFNEKREDLQGLFSQKASTAKASETNYNPLLSTQAINKAKTMMTPFVLRRKKTQVLKHLPQKHRQIVRCQLTSTQRNIYNDYLTQGKSSFSEGNKKSNAKNQPSSGPNVMMSLRKAALHPLLFRLIYTDEKLKKMAKSIMKEPEYLEANESYIFEDMQFMSDYELDNLCKRFPRTLKQYLLKDNDYFNSGKVSKLAEILKDIIDRGEKVLIFSLFTQMLDVLERVLTVSKINFLRLDGQTSVDTRQDLIDKFHEDDSVPVFLLSTRAGAFGINLVAASKVIIFDQSFNPHDDKQAEDRAHRVGQDNEVTVTKLISENTIEENMLQLAENKLELDESVSSSDPGDSKIEEKAASLVQNLIFKA